MSTLEAGSRKWSGDVFQVAGGPTTASERPVRLIASYVASAGYKSFMAEAIVIERQRAQLDIELTG